MSVISYFNKVGLLIFPFWTPHFVVWTPHFGWTPCLNYTVLTNSVSSGRSQYMLVAAAVAKFESWVSAEMVVAGDSGRGWAEGSSGAQGSGWHHQRVAVGTAAALPADARTDRLRKEFHHHLPDACRVHQVVRRQLTYSCHCPVVAVVVVVFVVIAEEVAVHGGGGTLKKRGQHQRGPAGLAVLHRSARGSAISSSGFRSKEFPALIDCFVAPADNLGPH